MRLRYTGDFPVSFVVLGRELSSGDEFLVPDDEAPGYLVRPDIEAVPEEPAPRTRKKVTEEPEIPVAVVDPEPLSDQSAGADSTGI